MTYFQSQFPWDLLKDNEKMRRRQAGECYLVRWCDIFQCCTGRSPATRRPHPARALHLKRWCGCGSLVLHRLVPTALSTLIASHSLTDTPRPRPVRRREAVLAVLQTPHALLSRPARPFRGAFLAVLTPTPAPLRLGLFDAHSHHPLSPTLSQQYTVVTLLPVYLTTP